MKTYSIIIIIGLIGWLIADEPVHFDIPMPENIALEKAMLEMQSYPPKPDIEYPYEKIALHKISTLGQLVKHAEFIATGYIDRITIPESQIDLINKKIILDIRIEDVLYGSIFPNVVQVGYYMDMEIGPNILNLKKIIIFASNKEYFLDGESGKSLSYEFIRDKPVGDEDDEFTILGLHRGIFSSPKYAGIDKAVHGYIDQINRDEGIDPIPYAIFLSSLLDSSQTRIRNDAREDLYRVLEFARQPLRQEVITKAELGQDFQKYADWLDERDRLVEERRNRIDKPANGEEIDSYP